MELLRLSGRVFHGAIESHLMLMFLAFKLSFDTDILAFFVSATLMPIFLLFGLSKKNEERKPTVDMEQCRLLQECVIVW
jgi:hypothetical protein